MADLIVSSGSSTVLGAGDVAYINGFASSFKVKYNKEDGVITLTNKSNKTVTYEFSAAAGSKLAFLNGAVTVSAAGKISLTKKSIDAAVNSQESFNVVAPAAFTLTASTDTKSFTGTAEAGRVYNPGGTDLVNALQSEDTLTGKGSADVLNITFGNANDAGAATVAPTLNNIETINFRNTGDNNAVDTLDFSQVTGTTAVSVSSLHDDSLMLGLDSTAIALTVKTVSNEAADVGFEYDDDALAGTADAVTLTVNGFQGRDINLGAAATEAAAGAGIETLNLKASGSSSTIANLGATGVTAINVDADATLTVSALSTTALTTLDLTGSTATTSINVGANIGDNVFAYTGGAGNDTLIASTGFTGTDSLNAGAGTADVLSIRTAAAAADIAAVGALSATNTVVATGFETLEMRAAGTAADGVATDFTVDMDTISGVTAIQMGSTDNDTAAVFTLNDITATQAANLSLNLARTGADADTDGTVVVDLATNTASDSVTLAATVAFDSQVITLNDDNNNIESATVSITGASNTVLNVDADSFLTSLTVTGGAATKTLTTGVAYANSTVDMSGVASNITFTAGGTTQTIKTGSGDDVITMNTGKKTVDLGAGDDTLSTTVAELGTATASWDTIVGGNGTDTLLLTSMAAVSAEAGVGISGFERLKVDAAVDPAADATINLAAFSDTFSRITVGDTHDDVVTFSNVSASFSDLRFDADAENDTEATLTRTIDAANNALTVTITGLETVKTLTVDNEESLTITSTNTDTATITTLNAADLTTLTLNGSGNVVITNAIVGSTALATVNASNLTAAATVNAGASTVNMTATANAFNGGVFTFTGGSGNDTITGGAGNDVLAGGAGTDTINGGLGADTITGGDGADTLTGGSGSDTYVYAAATVGSHGADTLADFAAGTSGDEIEIDIATDADVTLTEQAADALGAGGGNNATVFVITGGTAVDVSGAAAADLAALNAVLFGVGGSADADAESLVVINADTNGDGGADQIQVWWLHETGAAAGDYDDCALIGVISTLAANTNLAADFVAANFDFV